MACDVEFSTRGLLSAVWKLPQATKLVAVNSLHPNRPGVLPGSSHRLQTQKPAELQCATQEPVGNCRAGVMCVCCRFHLVKYSVRFWVAALLMAASFCIVALSSSTTAQVSAVLS